MGISLPIDKLKEIRDVALSIYKEKTWDSFGIYDWYAYALLLKNKALMDLAIAKSQSVKLPFNDLRIAIDDVLARCQDISSYPNNCKINITLACRTLKENFFSRFKTTLPVKTREEFVDKFSNTFDVISKTTSGRASEYAKICKMELSAMRESYFMDDKRYNFTFSEESISELWKTIDKCVKRSSDFAGVLSTCAIWYKYSRANELENDGKNLSRYLDSLVGAKGRLRKIMDVYALQISQKAISDNFERGFFYGDLEEYDKYTAEIDDFVKKIDNFIMKRIKDCRIEIDKSDLKYAKNPKAFFALILEKELSKLLDYDFKSFV